ncbi:MAG: hypothetical protein E6R04_02180 [Spirochaetes bacterium]|nr:MAG: hypothetical protein E6R04_02180 [Spirochaetota bacterium]
MLYRVGQKLTGTGMNDHGLNFEVVQVEPVVKVKCLSINEFWATRPLKPFPAPSLNHEKMWTPGEVYELRQAGDGDLVAADCQMPWHVFRPSGEVMYYR